MWGNKGVGSKGRCPTPQPTAAVLSSRRGWGPGVQAVSGSEWQLLLVYRGAAAWIPCRSPWKENYTGGRSLLSGWAGGRDWYLGLYANPWIPHISKYIALPLRFKKPTIRATPFSLSCCHPKGSSTFYYSWAAPLKGTIREITPIQSALGKAWCVYKISAISRELGLVNFDVYSQIPKEQGISHRKIFLKEVDVNEVLLKNSWRKEKTYLKHRDF